MHVVTFHFAKFLRLKKQFWEASQQSAEPTPTISKLFFFFAIHDKNFRRKSPRTVHGDLIWLKLINTLGSIQQFFFSNYINFLLNSSYTKLNKNDAIKIAA